MDITADDLTPDVLAAYIGGQMEIQTEDEVRRGKIAEIAIVKGFFTVRFAWVARGQGTVPTISKWINDKELYFKLGVSLFTVSNIGPRSGGSLDRLCLLAPIIEWEIVLFPKGEGRLDPAKVEGLVLAEEGTDTGWAKDNNFLVDKIDEVDDHGDYVDILGAHLRVQCPKTDLGGTTLIEGMPMHVYFFLDDEGIPFLRGLFLFSSGAFYRSEDDRGKATEEIHKIG